MRRVIRLMNETTFQILDEAMGCFSPWRYAGIGWGKPKCV